MEKKPVVHFEIPADDVKRAKRFYAELFGWDIMKFDMAEDSYLKGEPYYMIHAAETDDKNMVKEPGQINGGMMKRLDKMQGVVNYISVSDIDSMLKEIESHGGTVVMDKTEIGPNMGWIAMFKDTEGNLIGLHEAPAGK